MSIQTLEERIEANRRKRRYIIALFLLAQLALNTGLAFWIADVFQPLAAIVVAALLLVLQFLVYPLGTASAASMVSRALKAHSPGITEFDRVRSPLEDAALAAGIIRPDVMFLDEEYCGAFTLMRQDRGVVYITNGMLESLDEGELRAVFAHEVAHIANGDAALNNIFSFLWCPLVFFGRPLVSVMGLVKIVFFVLLFAPIYLSVLVTEGYVSSWRQIGMVFLMGLAFTGSYITIFSVFPRLITRNRDLLADEQAVCWTLQPETMVMALRRSVGTVSKRLYGFLNLMLFVPVDVRMRGIPLSPYNSERNMERRLDIVEKTRLLEKPNLPSTSIEEEGRLRATPSQGRRSEGEESDWVIQQHQPTAEGEAGDSAD